MVNETSIVVIYHQIDMEEYMEIVEKTANSVRTTSREAIIVGDVNAKSHIWQSSITNRRGEYCVEWIASLNQVVHNRGRLLLFVRGTIKSFIDVTLPTQKIGKKKWNGRYSKTKI